MLNLPALLLALCAYLVAVLICGAYQGPMSDGYRLLMLVLACVGFGALGMFIWSLRPSETATA